MDAIDKLIASGHAMAQSKVDWVRSSTAVAVPAGASLPDIGSEAALQTAVLAAPSIGYSTGPSGTALLALFQRWGIAEQLQPRLVQASPGRARRAVGGAGRSGPGLSAVENCCMCRASLCWERCRQPWRSTPCSALQWSPAPQHKAPRVISWPFLASEQAAPAKLRQDAAALDPFSGPFFTINIWRLR